jgi:putative GTP pyrophosphokinase
MRTVQDASNAYAEAMKKAPYSDLSFYDDNLGLYRRLKEEVIFAFEDALAFPIHSIVGRVKERKSVLGKILRKSYTSPDLQIEDLVGVRVICLYRADLEKVDMTIRSLFEVLTHEDKSAAAGDDRFGYMSVHYICRLSTSDSGPRYDRLRGLKFEVQVRTILMDAWANVSHHLAYKSEHSLPADKKKDFFALAAMIHMADGQFQELARASASSQPADSNAPLDRDSTMELLQALFPDRVDYLEPPEGIPPMTLEHLQRSASELVEEVIQVGYQTVGQLRGDLEMYLPAALEWEKDNPGPAEGGKLFRVGIARRALSMGNEKFRSLLYEKTYSTGSEAVVGRTDPSKPSPTSAL